MSKFVCNRCKQKKVHVKKWGLCISCYNYMNKKGLLKPESAVFDDAPIRTECKEFIFVRNYFDHKNWTHQPATFHMNGEKYSPDFYDAERNAFIEVSGSRQAYHDNKEKYALFRKTFPKINFEVRKHDGTILDESNDRLDWQTSNT